MNIAIILAAGQGTRMKSDIPKVLHKVCGTPMLGHVVECVNGIGIDQCVVVVGHGAEQVIEAASRPGTVFVEQNQQLGTGHAVMMAEHMIPEEGTVVVLCGDTPLITKDTLRQFFEYHNREKNCVSVLTAVVNDPTGYGRVIKSYDGSPKRITEEKDADTDEKEIKEINGGMYCFEAKSLKKYLAKLTMKNAQNEYYLTDIISLAAADDKKTGVFVVLDEDEIMGVNNRIQLAEAEAVMRKRIAARLMLEGVTIINPRAVYIENDVKVGRDSIIYPGAILTGTTEIGEGSLIGHNCRIENSKIGNRTQIQTSTIVDSIVGDDSTIGPYAYLRPKSHVGNHVKIGDFVEVKNATIGDGSKASHLSYIGDADIGRDVNVGCGVVFVNYDGVNKFRTTVEDGAFIGSNSNLVAPITVEKYGYIAAGTTVTRRVPNGALLVGRANERLIEGWGERKIKKKENK